MSVAAKPVLEVLIVGAGTSGLAAAFSLRQAGHIVTVLEAGDSQTRIKLTSALWNPPNAAKILERWGLGSWMEKTKITTGRPHIEWFDTTTGASVSLKALTDTRVDDLWVDYHAIRFCDLFDAILDLATSHGATIRYNSRVTAVDVNLGQLTLESGEILTGDLIVGADGVNSLLQSYVLRGEDHEEEEKSVAGKVPLFLGYLMEVPYNAIQDAAGKEFLDSSGIGWWQGDTMQLLARSGVHKTGYVTLHLTSAQFHGIDGLVEGVWREETPDLIKYGIDASLFEPRLNALCQAAEKAYATLHQLREPLKSFVDLSSARCLLVGSAAHPLPPFTSQTHGLSLEDAEVLGILLSKITSRSQLHQVLVGFEELRQDRSAATQTWEATKIQHFLLPEGPQKTAVKDAYNHALGQLALSNLSEEMLDKLWGKELDEHYMYDSKDAAEDWWSKWGNLVLQGTIMHPRPGVVVNISRDSPALHVADFDAKAPNLQPLEDEP